jgi:uncharacterized iron-regulated membrane protein
MATADIQREQTSLWQRWLRKPQRIWLRRAIFQVHLWSGIAIGLYILFISVTGSVLIYSNELYRAATPPPIISTSTAPPLTDDQLKAKALRVHPGYVIAGLQRPHNPDEAVNVRLRHGEHSEEVINRLIDPRTGQDYGDAVTFGIRFVSKLIDLHDNLFAGKRGRKINGIGALLILILALTGMVVWWPGISAWKRSLTVPRGLGWKRTIWQLHSVIGFWTLAFTLIFALSGIYLAIPDAIQDFVDRIDPINPANIRTRFSDRVIYWLAYLHFGRVNGIGIPCHGPGLCDQATKATWAFFGLAPAAMFVTGLIMWWNRVLRPRWK